MPRKFGSLKFYNDSRTTISGRYLIAPTPYTTYSIFDILKHKIIIEGLRFEAN